MEKNRLKKNLWFSLTVVAAILLTGCAGGGADKLEEAAELYAIEADRPVQIGDFLKVSEGNFIEGLEEMGAEQGKILEYASDTDYVLVMAFTFASTDLASQAFQKMEDATEIASDFYEMEPGYFRRLISKVIYLASGSEDSVTTVLNSLADLEQPVSTAPSGPQGKSQAIVKDLGVVHYTKAPKTWTLDVPRDFQKVEVGHYGKGKDEVHQFGGWNAWVKVNGEFAYKWVRFDKEIGSTYHNYIISEDVDQHSGDDKYLDITSMIKTGKNTITYYHYTEGDGIGIKLKIHLD